MTSNWQRWSGVGLEFIGGYLLTMVIPYLIAVSAVASATGRVSVYKRLYRVDFPEYLPPSIIQHLEWQMTRAVGWAWPHREWISTHTDGIALAATVYIVTCIFVVGVGCWVANGWGKHELKVTANTGRWFV